MSNETKKLEQIMSASKYIPANAALYTSDGISFSQETEQELKSINNEDMGIKFIGYLAEQSRAKIPLNGEASKFGLELVKGLTDYAVREGFVNSGSRSEYDMAPYLALVGALAAQPEENTHMAEEYCRNPVNDMPLHKILQVSSALRTSVRNKVKQYTSRRTDYQTPQKAVSFIHENAAA